MARRPKITHNYSSGVIYINLCYCRGKSFKLLDLGIKGNSSHYCSDLTALDIHSEEFGSLPPDVQHELLVERQQLEKHNYHNPTSLPQVRLYLLTLFPILL